MAQQRQGPPADAGVPPPYYDYPYGSRTNAHRALTLGEAVRLALENASPYRQSLLEEQIAREDVRQARAAFFPQFSVPLSYIGTTPSQVRGPDEPLTFSFVSASAINETTAFLNASGPIDLSGRLRASLRRSRALLASARAGTLVARRQLVIDTTDAYYGLALARQNRRLADETLALAEGFVNLAERLRQRGEGEEAEVFRARSAAAARRGELEQARLAESAAMSLLHVLTGVAFSTHLGVARLTQDVPEAADFMSYSEEMVKTRPELAQLDAQREASLEEERAARRELLPDLTYSLNAGFDAAYLNQLRRYSGGSAIVSLNIPVWNFGASKSRAAQARLRAQSLGLQRENTLRQLRQEFYTQRAAALAALARIKTAAAAAADAQRNVNQTFVNYRLNRASMVDVIDAQSNYAATRLEYYRAVADYHAARVRLEVDPAGAVTSRAASAPAGAHAPAPCSLTRARSPALAGLRLGMRADEVALLYPRLSVAPADEIGVARARLGSDDLAAVPSVLAQWPELETVDLEFADGALSFVRLNHRPTDRWESKDQFVSVTAAKLRTPGPWKPFYDWREKGVRDEQDLRDLAVECEGFRLRLGIGTEGAGTKQTPHVTLEDVDAARAAREREDALRRAGAEGQREKPRQ